MKKLILRKGQIIINALTEVKEMTKYRKKPIVIDAIQLTKRCSDVVVDFIGKDNIVDYCLGEFAEDECYIELNTLEGDMTAREYDWVIKGVNGEFYPCKDDIFKKTYDKVEDNPDYHVSDGPSIPEPTDED